MESDYESGEGEVDGDGEPGREGGSSMAHATAQSDREVMEQKLTKLLTRQLEEQLAAAEVQKRLAATAEEVWRLQAELRKSEKREAADNRALIPEGPLDGQV